MERNTAMSDRSSTSSGAPPLSLPDLDEANVRTTRGDPGTQSSLPPQPTPRTSTGMLEYMASSLQGMIGATPGQREEDDNIIMEGASDDIEMAQDGIVERQMSVHTDTPFHSTAPLTEPSNAINVSKESAQVGGYQRRSSVAQRRTNNDAAEEFAGIPIPEEGDGYGMTDDDDDTDEDISDHMITPEDLLHRLRQGQRIRNATGVLDPAVVIPAMERLIRERRAAHQESTEVRSVLLCERSGTQLVVLHPRGSWIKYRPSGRVYLASAGHQPLAGMTISKSMIRHLRNTSVVTHGGDSKALPPTPDDYNSAPYVNHRPRQLLSAPRAVRWYTGGPTSTAHCDWTVQEWDDYRREIADGLHPTLQTPPPSWPTNTGRQQVMEDTSQRESSTRTPTLPSI